MLAVLIALIRAEDGCSREQQELALLKLANVWLQRKNCGLRDGLLLVGVDFSSVEEFRQRVAPLGLGDADLEVIQVGEDGDLGECIEPVVSDWLHSKHPSAVSFLDWRSMLGESAYPELNWWWTGVEAEPVDELSSIYEGMRQLLPADFEVQAPTWLELLMRDSPVGMFDSEYTNFDIVMHATCLTRWLSAYDEVSENGFFKFDYDEAFKVFSIDLMRLGREAFQENQQTTSEAFDDEDATQQQLAVTCLRSCLATRSPSLAETLRHTFGSSTALLWALYTSIWPALKKPMNEACEQLFSGHTVEFGNFMSQWRFVEEGWSDVVEG